MTWRASLSFETAEEFSSKFLRALHGPAGGDHGDGG